MNFLLRLVTGAHVALYRLLGGRLVGHLGRAPVLLLTTTGRRSGRTRTTPLIYQRDGDRLVLIASNGGRPNHPAWWLNLIAHPEGVVEVGSARLGVTARAAESGERERLWSLMTTVYPGYDGYRRKTTRTIDVVVLTPRA
ncbi:MAG: nitroreductase family deazaflavin-dependent oxidoreductase [Dehalococcoidia bacterium]